MYAYIKHAYIPFFYLVEIYTQTQKKLKKTFRVSM